MKTSEQKQNDKAYRKSELRGRDSSPVYWGSEVFRILNIIKETAEIKQLFNDCGDTCNL